MVNLRMVNGEFLEIKNLHKHYPKAKTPALQNVEFSLAQGEILCLLGPSGCGKTTLLRLIAGLEQADSGQICLQGDDLAQVPPHRRDFGMMFQDFALFPHKNVFENIAFGLRMHRAYPADISARVAELLDLVDLPDFGLRDVTQLSGGEQQRVALARALAPKPRLLMLDEPLGALDRLLRERLILQLRQIIKQVGVTAIYVTHDHSEAFAIADKVAVLEAGQLAQLDTPETIFREPASAFVARFLGFENILPGTVVAGPAVDTPVGQFISQNTLPEIGAKLDILLRPEAGQLVSSTQGDNILRGICRAVSFRGRFYVLDVACGEQLLRFEVAQAPQVGEPVSFYISPAGVQALMT